MIKIKELIKYQQKNFNLFCCLLIFILIITKIYGNYHNLQHQQEKYYKSFAIAEKNSLAKDCNICYLEDFQQKIKLTNIFQLLTLINVFLLLSKKYSYFILQHFNCWYFPCAPPPPSKIYL